MGTLGPLLFEKGLEHTGYPSLPLTFADRVSGNAAVSNIKTAANIADFINLAAAGNSKGEGRQGLDEGLVAIRDGIAESNRIDPETGEKYIILVRATTKDLWKAIGKHLKVDK